MTKPTSKQITALYHVECFTAVYGRAPSFRELARLIGVPNPGTVYRRMMYAEKKGLVRGLTLTALGRAAVAPLLGG